MPPVQTVIRPVAGMWGFRETCYVLKALPVSHGEASARAHPDAWHGESLGASRPSLNLKIQASLPEHLAPLCFPLSLHFLGLVAEGSFFKLVSSPCKPHFGLSLGAHLFGGDACNSFLGAAVSMGVCRHFPGVHPSQAMCTSPFQNGTADDTTNKVVVG